MSVLAQTSSNDLDLSTKNLVVVSDIGQAAATKARNRFLLAKGEYFLDTRIGIPYFDIVFVKDPDLALIGRVFREALLSVPGIVDVPDLDLALNNSTRELDFTFRAICSNGAVITGGAGTPFIVELAAQ